MHICRRIKFYHKAQPCEKYAVGAYADSKDTDQTAQMRSLICDFAVHIYPEDPFPNRSASMETWTSPFSKRLTNHSVQDISKTIGDRALALAYLLELRSSSLDYLLKIRLTVCELCPFHVWHFKLTNIYIVVGGIVFYKPILFSISWIVLLVLLVLQVLHEHIFNTLCQ